MASLRSPGAVVLLAAVVMAAASARSDTTLPFVLSDAPGRIEADLDSDDALDLAVDLLPYTSPVDGAPLAHNDREIVVLYGSGGNSGSGGVALVDQLTGAQRALRPELPLEFARVATNGALGRVVAMQAASATEPGLLWSIDTTSGSFTPFPLVSMPDVVLDLDVEDSGDVLLLDASPSQPTPQILRIDQTTGVATQLTSGGFLNGIGASAALTVGTTYAFVFIEATPNMILEVDLVTGAQRPVTSGGLLEGGTASRRDVYAPASTSVIFATGAAGVVQVGRVLGSQQSIGAGGLLTGSPAFLLLASPQGDSHCVLGDIVPPVPAFELLRVRLTDGLQVSIPEFTAATPVGDLARTQDDQFYVASDEQILHVSTTNAVRRLTADGFLASIDDVAVAGDVFALATLTGPSTRGLVRVDPDTGSQVSVATGGLLAVPHGAGNGLGIDPSGMAFVLAEVGGSPKVIRIDTATGAQTQLPDGVLLDAPVDLAVHPLDGRLFLLDPSVGIYRKDTVTGVETLVNGVIDVSTGRRLAIDEAESLLVVLDIVGGSLLFEVNATTGVPILLESGVVVPAAEDIAGEPIPEPATALLQLSGGLLVGLLARRRAQRRLGVSPA